MKYEERDLDTKINQCFNNIVEEIEILLQKNDINNIEYLYKIDFAGIKDEVTFMDIEIHHLVSNILKIYFPNIFILSEEEYTASNYHYIKDYAIIDPIDGTSELIKGSDNWSCSIGLVFNDELYSGLLFFPKKKIKIIGIKNHGVRLNDGLISTNRNQNNTNIVAVSPYQYKLLNLKNIKSKEIEIIPIPTFTTKILHILLGNINSALYLPIGKKGARIWDYAASCLIISEFKGALTSLDLKPLPLMIKNVAHLNGWIATHFQETHKKVLNHVLSVIPK